jgi:hypothetical protein
MVMLTRDQTDAALEFVRTHECPPGLYVLVDGSAYGLNGEKWVEVYLVAYGDAAVYPVKTRAEDGRPMQHKVGEIMAARLDEPLDQRWPRTLPGRRMAVVA